MKNKIVGRGRGERGGEVDVGQRVVEMEEESLKINKDS